MKTQPELEEQLSSFDAEERRAALKELLAGYGAVAEGEPRNVNMHCHSFFSYNADGFSPSRIAWESRKAGLYAAGLCDFDVLDGLDEFLEAGYLLGLRTTVNMETRAFVKEQADEDINSPGEPGVAYVMGGGFVRSPHPDSVPGKGLREYGERAAARNKSLVARINPHVLEIAIDYKKDVLALTPGGTPTERHIIHAYANKAKEVFEVKEMIEFWAKTMNVPVSQSAEWMADQSVLEEKVRARLAKRGGLGYEQPSGETFPLVDDFIQWVLASDAIPMTTWLDGTSRGENQPRELLEMMKAKGAPALNIIPDRNWNISDPAVRDTKRKNLKDIVSVADEMDIPVNIGTEMNKRGLPIADELDGEALCLYKETFLRGARIMVGHTVLTRFCCFSYVGERADAEFKTAGKKNAFFEKIGGLPPVSGDGAKALDDMGPEKSLSWLREESARQ